jgi:hypothetical protein
MISYLSHQSSPLVTAAIVSAIVVARSRASFTWVHAVIPASIDLMASAHFRPFAAVQ